MRTRITTFFLFLSSLCFAYGIDTSKMNRAPRSATLEGEEEIIVKVPRKGGKREKNNSIPPTKRTKVPPHPQEKITQDNLNAYLCSQGYLHRCGQVRFRR